MMVLLCPNIWAQQNLVPNPSFENYSDCPHSNGSISLVPPWRKVGGGGGINLYHECGYDGYGIPDSKGGGGYANSGYAYSDLIVWVNNEVFSQHFEGNFLGTPLTSTLNQSKKYNVELYVSLWDSMYYGVSNLGVYFSEDEPMNDIGVLLNTTPQIVNETGLLLDKLGWTKIGGSFIATGGENFLTIGNFDGYENSSYQYVGNGGVPPANLPFFWEAAYYFIDDVSVVEDTTWHVSVDDIENEEVFNLYPNPAKENVTVETNNGHHMRIELYDAIGGLVLKQNMRSSREDIGVGHLPAGMYVITLLNKGTVVERRRLMLQ